MTNLFWPGDQRAGELMSDKAFLESMIAVEQAWLDGLIEARIAPADARADLLLSLDDCDTETIAVGADRDGNPVIGLVALLRAHNPPPTARWIHRGLTSQDTIDTALMLCLREVLVRVCDELACQIRILIRLVDTHRDAPALARTLTQPALPTTVGLKVAHWLDGLVDAAKLVSNLRTTLPVQVGGAAGTLAAVTELAGSVDRALDLGKWLATTLRLAATPPWHTTRGTATRVGDALVTCCDAWAHIAADVATGARAEIGEIFEGHGGTSSTMPHKRNPVCSILIRRTALTTGPLGTTLHAAAAASVDERSDGGWHAEWVTLQALGRRTVVAAAHASELVSGLRLDVKRAMANLAAANGLLAEQQQMAELTCRPAIPGYLGATSRLIDSTLKQARDYLKDTP